MKLTILRSIHTAILLVLWLAQGSWAQTSKSSGEVYVDKNGVMRWGKSNAEVFGFGVNYTVPFAYDYRMAGKLNVNPEKAIDDDVYHFARLGFDAYRVHVWDCEISDSVGNLLTNDHLRLFDYALMKMKERGMKFIITPIAYWPNGFPEPPEKTPGFATKYGKDACLTNPGAIQAQETYLYQFLNHINQYTGVALKDDPDILAFEICNEPHHHEEPEKVTAFINRMVKSMRNTGCKKPVFYNMSHSIQLADAYCKADIQGGTFQWYPTGLGARHEVKGNLLPNVNAYTIPFADQANFKKMAKIVYEFDAADVGRSYIYPAMARSFREAGIQWATQFAYDPTYMAYANLEYVTHYMNLVYAPQKALSLKIASEVFHRIPMYKKYGSYPDNNRFDVFDVDYERDLAEMVSENKFIYTNNTAAVPRSPEMLEQVAGYGNSAVVTYEGSGAYFLDRLEKGVWRLEVMPDAVWVRDPFERPNVKKEVSVINWRKWPMTINLVDLGEDYTITALNEGNEFSTVSTGKSLVISPGIYLLKRKGTTTRLNGNDRWNNISLKEFVAPQTTLTKTYVLHTPQQESSAGHSLLIEATVVAVAEPESVELNLFGAGTRPQVVKMTKTKGYGYVASVPENLLCEGFLKYYISVREKGVVHSYPSGVEGRPGDWDFYDENPFQVAVVSGTKPVYLLDAMTDADALNRQWVRGSSLQPASTPGKAELLVNIEKLGAADPENKEGKKYRDYSMRYYFGQKVTGRKEDIPAKTKLVFRGRSLHETPCQLQLALISKEGVAFGSIVTIGPGAGEYSLSLSDLKPIKLVSLPRPYPTFLPYYFERNGSVNLDMNALETLQISIGPGIPEDSLDGDHGVAIESVRLE